MCNLVNSIHNQTTDIAVANVEYLYNTLQSIKGTVKLEFSNSCKPLSTISMWLSGHKADGIITFCNNDTGITVYCTGYRDYSMLFICLRDSGADIKSINQIIIIEDQCKFNIEYTDICINRIRVANAFINWLVWQYTDSKSIIKVQAYWRFLAAYTLQSLIDLGQFNYHIDPWTDKIYFSYKHCTGIVYKLYRKGNHLKFETNNKAVLAQLNNHRIHSSKIGEICILRAWGSTVYYDCKLTDIWWTLPAIDMLLKIVQQCQVDKCIN